jgi:electron transfer flavoprotein alpha subunit
MENFGQVRQLAAAVAGQVAATRPPVLITGWPKIGSSARPEKPSARNL